LSSLRWNIDFVKFERVIQTDFDELFI
jgi:hypothetical protein